MQSQLQATMAAMKAVPTPAPSQSGKKAWCGKDDGDVGNVSEWSTDGVDDYSEDTEYEYPVEKSKNGRKSKKSRELKPKAFMKRMNEDAGMALARDDDGQPKTPAEGADATMMDDKQTSDKKDDSSDGNSDDVNDENAGSHRSDDIRRFQDKIQKEGLSSPVKSPLVAPSGFDVDAADGSDNDGNGALPQL